MKTLLKTAALATAAVAIFGATAQSASASNRYAVTTIENPFSNITITYQYKWGNGQWRSATLYPGQSRWHSWQYRFANENRSPKLYIRFDSDRRAGVTYFQTYSLVRYAVPDQASRGKVYRFKFNGPARQYIDLYGTN